MNPAKKPTVAVAIAVEPSPSGMGSEYMDAKTYLKQPTRVKPSDPSFHGSNESDFGSTAAVAEID